ncbi:hypothetical protein [Streptomyces sp. NPDC048659]|uniref:hypothetical protein n=1 Tax=Streptomyces sp. NPDC048659 TaxID=3155489 RepID=UPI00342C31E1
MNGTTHTCPGCGRHDLTQAVPAVYLAGRTAVTSRERDAGGAARTVTRIATTALADALAPLPRRPGRALGGLGMLAAVVGIGAFLGGRLAEGAEGDGAGAGFPQDTGPDLAFLDTVAAVALGVVVFVAVVLLGREAAFALRTRGRGRAEELWSHGWYCHRCGTVTFHGVPGEDRVPLSLQGFRERVWERGGYGPMAVRRPVTGR